MQIPCANYATKTDRGKHQQAARKSLSAVWEHGVDATGTDAGHKRGTERRNSSTVDAEAYKVLQDHMEESVIMKEVLRDWLAYYGQVY